MKQMTRDELAFYIHDRTESFRVEIKGQLCRGNAPSIAEAVRTAEPTIAGRAVVVDIEGLTGIDAFGRSLLRDWHDAGVQITATSHSARLLVRSVTGEPPFLGGGATALKKWWSWATRFIPFLALLFPALGIAANLAPQTLAAWERYVESEKLTMERRVSAGKAFLLVDEAPERLAKLRAGEVVFSPGAPRNLTRVPGGLIHDWVGAVFVPGVELADVLAVVSDFASYKNYYKPTVVDSKVIASTDIGGPFSMLLLNQSLLMGTHSILTTNPAMFASARSRPTASPAPRESRKLRTTERQLNIFCRKAGAPDSFGVYSALRVSCNGMEAFTLRSRQSG